MRRLKETGFKFNKKGRTPALPERNKSIAIYFRTASLSRFPARKTGTFVAGMAIAAPVWGLRPVRAFFLEMEKVPKPVKLTFFPFFSWVVTPSINVSMADVAWPFVIPVL